MRSGDKTGVRYLGHKTSDVKVLEGGVHLTHTSYLPNSIIKELTATENDYYSQATVNFNYLFTASVDVLNLEQRRAYDLYYRQYFDSFRGTVLSLYTCSCHLINNNSFY